MARQLEDPVAVEMDPTNPFSAAATELLNAGVGAAAAAESEAAAAAAPAPAADTEFLPSPPMSPHNSLEGENPLLSPIPLLPPVGFAEPGLEPPPAFAGANEPAALPHPNEQPSFITSPPPRLPSSPPPTGFDGFEGLDDGSISRPDSGDFGFGGRGSFDPSEDGCQDALPPRGAGAAGDVELPPTITESGHCQPWATLDLDAPPDVRVANGLDAASAMLENSCWKGGRRSKSEMVQLWDAGHNLASAIITMLAKLKTQSTIEEADILPSTSATAQLIESAVAPCSAEAVDGADGSAEELRIVQCVNTVGNAAVVAVGALRAIEVGSEPTIRRSLHCSDCRMFGDVMRTCRCIAKYQALGERVHILIGVLQDVG